MVWLPNFDTTTIQSLPINSIFFALEGGGVMFDEKLYVLLRSSGLLAMGSKPNRLEEEAKDPQVDDQSEQRVKESQQTIMADKLTTLTTLREKTQQQISIQSPFYATKQLQQTNKMKLFKLKLELLFEEKLLQYELNEEENENEQLKELTNKIQETVSECRGCQQNIESMNEMIEEKNDELLKTKVSLMMICLFDC